MNEIDVLCIGATSYDLTFGIDRHPLADEKMLAKSLSTCGGGPAANAAVTVARLGLKAAFCGYLGNDIYGRLHLAEFKKENVDIRFVISGEQPTPVSAILVKPNGERSLINYRYAPPISRNYPDLTIIKPRVILFDGHEPHISKRVLTMAQKQNITTILDAGSVNPGTRMLYDKVDYLVCSEVFAEEQTGKKGPEALSELSKNIANTLITLGDKGVIWNTENGTGSLPAYQVEALDTTGAGDVFHGAFASCIAQHKDWEYTVHFASAAAALCCTKVGARPSIPGVKAVISFMCTK